MNRLAIVFALFVCSISAQTVTITPATSLIPPVCEPAALQSCGPQYRITVTGIEGAPIALRYIVTARFADGNTFTATGIVPVPVSRRPALAFATFQLPETAVSFTWRIEFLGVVATFVGAL